MKKIKICFICLTLFMFCLLASCGKKDNEPSENVYIVKFIVNEEVVKTEEVAEGKSATAPSVNVEGYDFLDWDCAFDNVTSNLEVRAILEIKTYTVVFKLLGSNFKTVTVNHGEAALAPSNINLGVGYTFKGWDKDTTCVTSDLEVNAILDVNKFTVTLLGYGGVVAETKEVEYGSNLNDLTLPDTESHKFIGWFKDLSFIDSDITVQAKYEIKTFTVIFKDEDGTVLKEEIVEYGKDAIGLTPDRKGTLSFIGWDKSIKNVKGNLEVVATYGIVSHNISFFDGSEKLDLGMKTYNEGEVVTLPTYEKEGYEFIGWFLSDLSMTNYKELDGSNTTNLLLYARFLPLANYNQIVLPESTYKFTTVNKGTTYQAPLPSGAPSGVTNYDWTTSDSSVATVSIWSSITAKSAGYCVLTATYKADPSITINCIIKVTSEGVFISSEEEANHYEVVNVTFKGMNDEVIGTAKCAKGGSVIYPIPTVYEGYKFVGWDRVNYNITEDTVIYATYEKGVNNYTGKSFAIIGDSISTYQSYIPDGFSCFYPYPTADVSDVNKTWWMQVINSVGGSLFVNNSYSGSCVADSSSSATKNMERLEYTTINGVTPDVILIYMGSNDCASKYVSAYDFERDYPKMIENLQKLCPNSEIILCTLATSPFYSVEDQTEYNDIIKMYAETYNLKCLDLASANLAGKLVDSAHPNTAGMTEFANVVIEKLLEEDE